MNVGWQDIAALGLVAAALVYLIWRLRRKRRIGCGYCRGCPDPSRQTQLPSIDPPNNGS